MSETTHDGPRVFRDYDQGALDAQYDQRTLVPDITAYVERWTAGSEAARSSLAVRRDLAYGPSASERIDLFPGAGGGLVAYLHGGAWRMLSRSDSAYPASAFLAQGVGFAAIDFALVPSVRLEEQVRQSQAALAWLWRNAADIGVDRERICVLGHSSGAHLAAMVATTDWAGEHGIAAGVVRAVSLVSGIYDLEPVRLSARNEYLQLDASRARALSPINRLSMARCAAQIAWGDGELDEFERQSQEMAAAWAANGQPCTAVPLEGCNHFDTSLAIADPASPIVTTLVASACGR